MDEKKFCTIGGNWPPPDDAGGDRQNKSESVQTELSPADLQKIRSAIRAKYAEVSVSSSGKFAYPTGKEGATTLEYDAADIEAAPLGLLDSFCGVGNPFSLGSISGGETILDIGCGAGFDMFVACRKTGEQGKVFGIDLTKEMASRARNNLDKAGMTNFEIITVDNEKLPFADNFFEVVISNGVINLSPCKQELFSEIFRVLKPGGRLQFADVILEGDLPPQMHNSAEAWSQWIGGTIPVGDQIDLLKKSGFIDVDCPGKTGFYTSPQTVGALFVAGKN